MGAGQLFCALAVARGLTFAQTRRTKKFADFKAFLGDLFQRSLCAGIKVLHLMLDNGPPTPPNNLPCGGLRWSWSFEWVRRWGTRISGTRLALGRN